jgi:hypothetical protein
VKTRSFKWRRRLRPGDKEMLLRWIEMSSLEQVARIAAALTDPDGERAPDKLDTLLLLKMAHMARQQSDRSIHDIAEQLAAENQPHRNHTTVESLTSRLEREYKMDRHTWPLLAESTREPAQQDIDADLTAEKTNEEFRARVRIVGMLPSKIDLVDWVRAEAVGAGKLDLIEKLGRKHGRERLKQLILDVIERGTLTFPLKDPRFSGGRMPRTLFDHIESDLKAILESET